MTGSVIILFLPCFISVMTKTINPVESQNENLHSLITSKGIIVLHIK